MYNSSILNSTHTYSIIVSLKFILVNNYLNESELEPGENSWLVIETTNFMPTENSYHIELGVRRYVISKRIATFSTGYSQCLLALSTEGRQQGKLYCQY